MLLTRHRMLTMRDGVSARGSSVRRGCGLHRRRTVTATARKPLFPSSSLRVPTLTSTTLPRERRHTVLVSLTPIRSVRDKQRGGRVLTTPLLLPVRPPPLLRLVSLPGLAQCQRGGNPWI